MAAAPPCQGALAAASWARGGWCKVRASSLGPSEARGRLWGGIWDRCGVVAWPPSCWGGAVLAAGCRCGKGLMWLVGMLFLVWVQGDAAHGLCRMPWCQPCRATGSGPLFSTPNQISDTTTLTAHKPKSESFGSAAEGKAVSGVIPPSSSWLPHKFPAPRRMLQAAAGLSARRVGALVCSPGAERAGKPPARRTQARGCR